MTRLPLVLMRLLTPVAFVAILVTARPPAEREWAPLAASAASGLAFAALDLRWPRAAGVLLSLAALFGTVVTVADQSLTGPSLVCLSLLVLSSLTAIPPVEIVTVAVVVGVAATVGGHLAGQPAGLVAGNALAVAVVVLLGLNRRQYRVQARQARDLLDQTRLAQEAVARGATLEERARLAREVHDIQAHSLSALSLHLQAARRGWWPSCRPGTKNSPRACDGEDACEPDLREDRLRDPGAGRALRASARLRRLSAPARDRGWDAGVVRGTLRESDSLRVPLTDLRRSAEAAAQRANPWCRG